MQYEKKIGEIFERHPSVQVSGFTGRAYKAGIESMEAFDAVLGHPWRSFRCIHVAGTNGKGSVSSMLAASLAASGLRVGLYTSPHLLDFRERIKIISGETPPPRNVSSDVPDGTGAETPLERSREISKEDVMEFLERYEKEIENLSFFEITTGMAFWWFREQKVDVAVIEVGLGGRLDSTNVIVPELSVVTSIGLDHCAMLGNTRAEIALEKAGIFKSGVPALVWGHDPETDAVFEGYAAKVGAPLHYGDEMITEVPPLEMDLRGEYQRANLRTVLAALKLLAVEPSDFALEHTAALTGLRGRWEILRKNPTVICDIGHNPPALKHNFRQLVTPDPSQVTPDPSQVTPDPSQVTPDPSQVTPDPFLVTPDPFLVTPDPFLVTPDPFQVTPDPIGGLVIVYGIMADKALEDIAPLMPAAARYILCAPDSSRSMPVDELHRRLAALRPELSLQSAPSVADAVRLALSLAGPGDTVYIGGSTFVVAEALPLFE